MSNTKVEPDLVGAKAFLDFLEDSLQAMKKLSEVAEEYLPYLEAHEAKDFVALETMVNHVEEYWSSFKEGTQLSGDMDVYSVRTLREQAEKATADILIWVIENLMPTKDIQP